MYNITYCKRFSFRYLYLNILYMKCQMKLDSFFYFSANPIIVLKNF